jgi:hypothetical protein
MVVKIASYNDGTTSYNAEVEETKWTDYRIIARLNECAEAVITLADPTGSLMRKYNVDANDVFIGPGRLTIEKPAGTDIFDGRVLKALGDSGSATGRLLCKDWLSQLEDPIVTKDMREDLDGSGLRESGLKPHVDSVVYVGPVYTSGADYYMFDDDMDWDVDEWNGKYLVLASAVAGKQTISTGPYNHGIDDQAGGGVTDDGNVENTWVADGSVHTMSQDADFYFRVLYRFRINVFDGTLSSWSDVTGVNVVIDASLENSGVNLLAHSATVASVRVYNNDTGFYESIGTIDSQSAEVSIKRYSFAVPKEKLDSLDTGAGDGVLYADIRVYCTSAGSGTVFKVDKIAYELETFTLGHSAAILIEDTFRSYSADFDYACMYEDGVGYTDETTDMADAGAGDVQLLPNPLSRNDCFYFGCDVVFQEFKITISQAGVHDGSITWQYWDGDSWESLAGVTDGTNDFETAGASLVVSWTVPSDWATCAVNGQTHYWVRAWQWAIAPAITVTPLATQGWAQASNGNRLEVNTDLSTANLGLWVECPYSIVQPVYKHIDTAEGGTLVSDHDPLVTLTAAAGIEHTSGFSTRRYENHVPLVILQDLANIDKVAFYIPLGTTALTWKSTFNDAAPTAMTDASVIKWGYEYSFIDVRNGYILYGPKINDDLLRLDTKDITGGDPGADSKSTYGVSRYGVIKNAGVTSEYELSTLGSAIVERDEDVLLFLNCDIAGLSALRLGDEVSITSTIMGLTAEKYVIIYWEYSYSGNITKLRLHPRLSTKGFVQHRIFSEDIRRQQSDLRQITADANYPAPETST